MLAVVAPALSYGLMYTPCMIHTLSHISVLWCVWTYRPGWRCLQVACAVKQCLVPGRGGDGGVRDEGYQAAKLVMGSKQHPLPSFMAVRSLRAGRKACKEQPWTVEPNTALPLPVFQSGVGVHTQLVDLGFYFTPAGKGEPWPWASPSVIILSMNSLIKAGLTNICHLPPTWVGPMSLGVVVKGPCSHVAPTILGGHWWAPHVGPKDQPRPCLNTRESWLLSLGWHLASPALAGSWRISPASRVLVERFQAKTNVSRPKVSDLSKSEGGSRTHPYSVLLCLAASSDLLWSLRSKSPRGLSWGCDLGPCAAQGEGTSLSCVTVGMNVCMCTLV